MQKPENYREPAKELEHTVQRARHRGHRGHTAGFACKVGRWTSGKKGWVEKVGRTVGPTGLESFSLIRVVWGYGIEPVVFI